MNPVLWNFRDFQPIARYVEVLKLQKLLSLLVDHELWMS